MAVKRARGCAVQGQLSTPEAQRLRTAARTRHTTQGEQPAMCTRHLLCNVCIIDLTNIGSKILSFSYVETATYQW